MKKINKQEISNSKHDSTSIRNYLVNEINTMVANRLSIPLSSVLPEQNLYNIGLTSLDTIKISTMISLLLSTKISAAIMYGQKNIKSLAGYLCERYPAQVENSYKNNISNTQSVTDCEITLKSNSQNIGIENTYSRSRHLQNSKKIKYYFMISGSGESEIVYIVKGISSYIKKHHDNDREVLIGLELYFIYERPQLFHRLAIVCEDLKSLKNILEMYLNKKKSNCYRANGDFTFRNINLFKSTGTLRNNMVDELFEKNKIDTIAYIWSNGIDIDIKSQYSQFYIEQFLPHINKIKEEMSCSCLNVSMPPSVVGINHNNA